MTVIDQLGHGKIACLCGNTSHQQHKGSTQQGCYFPAKEAELNSRIAVLFSIKTRLHNAYCIVKS